jgi:hypothetical protein
MISLVALSGSYVDLNVQSQSTALDELYPGKFVPLETWTRSILTTDHGPRRHGMGSGSLNPILRRMP